MREDADPRSDGALDFERVVEQHQRQIYRLGLALTGDHHDAEDLAQQTFLKAYRGRSGFRADADVSTWLHRIAVNTYIDSQRGLAEAARRSQSSLDEDELELGGADERVTVTPERTAASADIERHIEGALRSLPPRERAVFVLRHYQDLKLREIAETLDVSLGTVKTLLFRGIRRLRTQLACYRPELGLKETS